MKKKKKIPKNVFAPVRGPDSYGKGLASFKKGIDNLRKEGWPSAERANANRTAISPWPEQVDVIRQNGCEQGEYLIPNCECGNGSGYPMCSSNYCCKKCNVQDDDNPDWDKVTWKKFHDDEINKKNGKDKMWGRYYVNPVHKNERCPKD